MRPKNTKFIAIICLFQVPDAPKPVFGRGSAVDPSLRRSPRFLFGWGGDIESWNTHILPPSTPSVSRSRRRFGS